MELEKVIMYSAKTKQYKKNQAANPTCPFGELSMIYVWEQMSDIEREVNTYYIIDDYYLFIIII